MSVIVRDEEGSYYYSAKGPTDSVMFERLAKDGGEYEEETREHVNEYADAGLRTLILAYRELGEDEYEVFDEKFQEAKNSVSADREALIDDVTYEIERDLILLGDKLQQGVPECIDKLAQPGIKIWVLTGDKMETAINIGYACSLLRQGMKQITITLENPEIKALEKAGEKDAITKVTRLVKEGTKKTTLTIGDGVNNVGMLQEADIGIGISGVEGMQVAIRNIRRDAIKSYEKLEKEKKLSEDNVKDLSADLQKVTDEYMKKIDSIYKQKKIYSFCGLMLYNLYCLIFFPWAKENI